MLPTLFDQYSQSSKEVLFLYNLQTGQFDYLSPSFELIWEMNRDQVLQAPGLLLAQIEEQDKKEVALLLEKMAKGLGGEIEFGLQFPDKRSKQVKVDAHPLLDATGVITQVMG